MPSLMSGGVQASAAYCEDITVGTTVNATI